MLLRDAVGAAARHEAGSAGIELLETSSFSHRFPWRLHA
jgi:hypothetical protein